MMIVDHPNIIKLYETYEDELYLHLVMELCKGGDICDRLIKIGSFSESEAAHIMKQLLRAVNYLHLKNINNRDLKPENFLYESETSDDIKICDFGMSIKTSARMKSLAGTPYYLAPEVIQGTYTKSCDVWSLGVFMHFILVGRHPFKGSDLDSIYEKATQGVQIPKFEQFTRISDNAKDLLKKMLHVQPSKRITINEAVNHPWFIHFEQKKEPIPAEVFNALCKYRAKSKL